MIRGPFESWGRLLAGGALVLLASVISAQARAEIRDQPEAMIRAYLNAHNRHDLGAEIEFYSEDAVFVLSQGRGEVRGRAAIARLLRFDVAAGSAVSIDKLDMRRDNSEVVIDIGPATERSRVFAALGIPIMRSSPTKDAFRIRDGKLSFVRQPEFTEACGAVAGDAMRVFGGWLKSNRPDAYASLYHDYKLNVRADIVNIWIADIRAWRSSTGWRPDRIALANCTNGQPFSPRNKKARFDGRED